MMVLLVRLNSKVTYQKKGLQANPWDIKELFRLAQTDQLDCSKFVTWVLASRINATGLAILKLNLENHIKNHADANPPEQNKDIKTSFLKFNLIDEKQKQNKHQSFELEFGVDKNVQNSTHQLIKQLIGKESSKITFHIRLRAKNNPQELRDKLEAVLNELKTLGTQLSQDIQKILNYLDIFCKVKDNDVYVIFQLNGQFFADLANTIDQFILMANPNCQLHLSLRVESSMFNSLLTKGLNSDIKQLLLKIALTIDSATLKKIKKIVNKQNPNLDSNYSPQITSLFLFTLFQQLQFQATFSNLNEFLAGTGLKQHELNPQLMLSSLKQMSIKETLNTFSPSSLELIQFLKNSSENYAQFCLCFKDLFLKLTCEFGIEGIFDLII